jgi:pimeloyl-ACP methyl ester carboxylesterase
MAAKIQIEDMIVILPGILGSVLKKDDKDLWAVSGQSIWNLVKHSQKTIEALELSSDDYTLDDLGDGIRPTQLIEDVHLIPGLVKVDGYTQTSRMITDNFAVIEGDIYNDPEDKSANFYHFPYDWRRDNRANARILKKLLDKRLSCWRKEHPNAKLILLAHSMGGLVSRYYLEVLEGWRDARVLFTFGTPYRGSIKGLSFLANGYKKLFLDLTQVIRSLPSVYQLLPIYQAIKVGEDYRRVTEIDDFPNVDKARALDARAFHDEIYEANKRNKEIEAYQNTFTTVPIVGVNQPTLQSAHLINGELIASYDLPAILQGKDFTGGDGTVPKISAIPSELSNSFSNLFIAEGHGALQNQEQILQTLKDAIATTQFANAADVRDVQHTIGLAVDDLYLPDEPIALQAQVIAEPEVTGLQALVTPVSPAGSPLTFSFTQQQVETWSLTIDDLPAGLYRVAVSAEGAENQELPFPVHSSFEVIDTID